MARKLGVDPAIVATEPDPNINAARLAAAIIYQQEDEKADAEQKAKTRRK